MLQNTSASGLEGRHQGSDGNKRQLGDFECIGDDLMFQSQERHNLQRKEEP